MNNITWRKTMRNYIKTLKPSELITLFHLLVVLFGLPLVFHYGYFDIGPTKYYFYCGASALLIPALFFKIRERRSLPAFFKGLTAADKALLVYWAAAGLSTLFSPYKFEAFWGNEGRFCGLFLTTIYVVVYLIVTRCHKPHSICVRACILSGSIVFLLAIADYFNLNLLHFKDNVNPLQIPIFMSTIGNINFYAGYGAIILGLIAGLYVVWPELRGAAVLFALMVLAFIGLIIGNSDNAYLTFGVLLAFLPLFLFKSRRGIRRYMMMVSGFLLSFMIVKMCDILFAGIVLKPDGIRSLIDRWDGFIFVCVAFWLLTAAVYKIDYKRQRQNDSARTGILRIWIIFLALSAAVVIAVLIDANLLGHAGRYGGLRNYVVFSNDWGTHRGYVWSTAIKNYMEFPLLQKIFGHGPDTYGIVSLFRNLPESAGLYGELYDSVHNEYLQYFVTIGPIGTGAYIMFLVFSVRDILRCRSPYTLGITFSVLCYCTQAIVSISQPATTPVMWAVLAVGIAYYRRTVLDTAQNISAQNISARKKGQVPSHEE